ncbi:MAG: hypothetical protein GKR87_01800 [Kiritimatiellae bacterium]|nr:hypothetical protein [Kiritimatiellia bacterium]
MYQYCFNSTTYAYDPLGRRTSKKTHDYDTVSDL